MAATQNSNEPEGRIPSRSTSSTRPDPDRDDTRSSLTLHEGAEASGKAAEKQIVVSWDGDNDPECPLNWPTRKKWVLTTIVSAFTFISPVSSSMVAPAVDQVGRDLGITSSALLGMALSIFVLAYAVGPLFFGPASEVFGRVRILQTGNAIFCAFNLGNGFAQTPAQFMVLRFLAGIGGSPPLAVGGALLGDMWRPHERGKAVAAYTLMPLLGPAFAPVLGGFIAEYSTWRWVFWSTTIAAATIQFFGLFFLEETYAPVLLERRARKLRQEMGIPVSDHTRVTTQYAQGKTTDWGHMARKALVRPFAIFFREPIIVALASYMAFVYGICYLVISTLPGVYGGVYHQATDIASLHYIALGLGLTVASQTNARAMDKLYKFFQKKEGRARPEHRLPSMFVGSAVIPAALLIYGWTAQEHVFWFVPDIGLFLIGVAMILVFQSIQLYVIDTFKLNAASALAATVTLRSLAGFGFPLFAPAMYASLGYGKGNTVLAAVAIAIGCPAPWLLWVYGEKLRGMSRNAVGEKAAQTTEPMQKRDEEAKVGTPASTVAAEGETEKKSQV